MSESELTQTAEHEGRKDLIARLRIATRRVEEARKEIENQSEDRTRKGMPVSQKSQADYEGAAPLISWLSPALQRVESQSVDLRSFARFAAAVTEAVESGIITDEEAESLMATISARFVERRLDSMFMTLFAENKRNVSWLFAARRQYERASH